MGAKRRETLEDIRKLSAAVELSCNGPGVRETVGQLSWFLAETWAALVAEGCIEAGSICASPSSNISCVLGTESSAEPK